MIRISSLSLRPIAHRCRLAALVLSVVVAVVVVAPGVAHASGAPTTTTLTVDPNPAAAGQKITLSAHVTSDAGTPTGTVAFYNGPALVTSAPLTPAAGSTTTSVAQATTLLPGGTTYALQAFYDSDAVATYTNSSSTAVSEPVGSPAAPVPTTTTLSTSSARAITSRQAVVLAARVSAANGASTPTGQVAFLDNGVILGTATLDKTGTATLASGDFGSGTDTIEADYRGDNTNAASSATSTVVVAATGSPVSASATTLSISTTRAITSREPVTLTAHVAVGGAAPPSGSVTFRDNGILLGTAPLDADGSARITTGGFLSGANTVDADYPGARTIEPSNATVTFVIAVSSAAALPTHATLTTNTARIVSSRQSVTFTVHVAAPHGDAHPAGVVAFIDNGVLLGSALLDSKGIARLTTGGFRAGPNTIEADYRGSDKDAPSFAKVTLVVPRTRATTERTTTRG